jgi:hypothetical protein
VVNRIEIKPRVTKVFITSAERKTEIRVSSGNKVKAVLIGTQGPKGSSGSKPLIYGFQFNNVANQVIHTFVNDGFLIRLRVEIKVPFDGENADISVGTNADPFLLLNPSEINVREQMGTSKEMISPVNSGEQVRIFISAGNGATQGEGQIILEFI